MILARKKKLAIRILGKTGKKIEYKKTMEIFCNKFMGQEENIKMSFPVVLRIEL